MVPQLYFFTMKEFIFTHVVDRINIRYTITNMTFSINTLKKKRFFIPGIILIVIIFLITRGEEEATKNIFAVVEEVKTGTVSSGIETTGEIIAAQKLNLDVYKQLRRIESVNVTNGGSVAQGQVMFSFDKSSANVNVQSAQVDVTAAQLSLQTAQENYLDLNTNIKSLSQQIEDLTISIEQTEEDKVDAYKKYLNASATAEPASNSDNDLPRPIISGFYNGVTPGEYLIKTYSSSTASGKSYRVDGLGNQTEAIISGSATDLGSDGLQITFPSDTRSNKEWIVTLPNTSSTSYSFNREVYQEAILDFDKRLASLETELRIAEQLRDDENFTDDTTFRDLNLSQAQARLSEARVALSENFEVVRDQDIVAPFSGTIEGMENVVVGATPTRDTNDPISFGTLISDEFLATFSLSAIDVGKVAVGQKVLVSITTLPNTPPLTARIIEISSLPESESVAQYEVQALIEISEDTEISLREGLLADIEIVQEEVTDVVRVPKSAITFENGNSYVDVIEVSSKEELQRINEVGILRTEDGTFPSYPQEVTVGITGVFYSEITSGVEQGTTIIVSKNNQETSAVQQSSFRGGPPRDSQDTSSGRPQ